MFDFLLGRRTYSQDDYEALRALHKSSQEQIAHLLNQRDKIAEQRDALAKELEIRTETCANAMREVERLTNELHTYEVVSTPPPTEVKPSTRRQTPARKKNT